MGSAWAPPRRAVRFVPWGHDSPGEKLLEAIFWETDWNTIAQDFRRNEGPGANVMRVHFAGWPIFMEAADRPNRNALERLEKLIKLSREEVGIYLDVTRLACYRTSDVPSWYDQAH